MSFHTNYDEWLRLTDSRNCGVCNALPMPEGMVDVVELPHSWLEAEPIDCLKGACHLVAKQHVIELYDLDDLELLGYMKELQLCIRAVKQVTQAIHINVEMHGNTVPHLHTHIYPRYLDDPFPGRAIDYTQQRNQYAAGEFDAFVQAMRAEIARLQS